LDRGCALTDLGLVLRDAAAEYGHSPALWNRLRASLGHIPEAYEYAATHGSDAVWGSRRVWAPLDCGDVEDKRSPSGCNRLCNRGSLSARFPGLGSVSYTASLPVSVGKAATCEKFSDLPHAARYAASARKGGGGGDGRGYSCVEDFPVGTFTGAGCNDDFTGVHVAPTLAKNRPVVDTFDHLHQEGGVSE
jgi:hypothetical protein